MTTKNDITQTFDCYIINNKLYVNYNNNFFDSITLPNNDFNLIRIGYDKRYDKTDFYLIEVNDKIRKVALKNYPHIKLEMNIKKYNKDNKDNDIIKSYPYHGKNTTILNNNNNIFIENTNIYPKYFRTVSSKLDKYEIYNINTIITLNFEQKSLSEIIKKEIYSLIFHLRMEIFFSDDNFYILNNFFDKDGNIEAIEYNLGKIMFDNGYYGSVKRIVDIQIDETTDISIDKENDYDSEIEYDSNTESKSDDEYLPDIVKLNIKLTDKIIDLERQINIINSDSIQHYNNLNYKIITINDKLNTSIYINFVLFLIIAIYMYAYSLSDG